MSVMLVRQKVKDGSVQAAEAAARRRRLLQPVRNPARGVRRSIGRAIWARAAPPAISPITVTVG
jgi:hypothetical protein